QRSFGCRAPGVSRFALTAIPELHGVPSEDPRKPRGPESTEMKRLLIVAIVSSILAAPIIAQDPVQQPAAPAAANSKPAESPVPSSDSWLTGLIDFGYRWRTRVAGSFDAYRSIVNR